MRLAVFSNSFPVLSQSFVINQIVGLLEENADVDILTNNLKTPKVMHEAVKQHELLKRVKAIGFSFNANPFFILFKTLWNCLYLSLTGQRSVLLSILNDSHLSLIKKMNLIEAVSSKKPKLEYDNIIVHFGNRGYYVCKMRELGLISGPISVIFHGYEVSRYKVIDKHLTQYQSLFKQGDMMLPISNLWKERLISWGCPPEKIQVHRMGVDVDDFSMRALDKPFSKPLKLVQVGRLTGKKAILDSINAVIKASDLINIEFIVIGSGDLFKEADKIIKDNNANGYIKLLGQQPQAVVKQYLADSDVFLLPSVVAKCGDMEGVPVALMESMATGLITVSTQHSGIPELIENGVSGYLVPEHDVDSLAYALISVQAMSVEEVIAMRTNARNQVEQCFNNKTLNKSLVLLSKEL